MIRQMNNQVGFTKPSFDDHSKKVIAVTGPSSFIGKHLIRSLCELRDIDIRVLVHRHRPEILKEMADINLVEGDLLRSESLKAFLVPGCTVINLVHLRGISRQDNLNAAANLAVNCAKAGVRRFVHCSTAVVAGKANDNPITEKTRCFPVNEYERTKLDVEALLADKAKGNFDLAILRPTVVFGPGGKNLLKMANDLISGSPMINYLKSCLFGYRRMNLVSVHKVVAALVFLVSREESFDGGIFIVSDDEQPLNSYRDVEKCLMRSLGLRDYRLPMIYFPQYLLSILLKLAGRSNSNPFRNYYDGKLRGAGFQFSDSFDVDLAFFADCYKKRFVNQLTNSQ